MDSLEAKAAQLAKKVLSDGANKSNINKARDIMFVRSDAKGGEQKAAEGTVVKNPDEINIDEDEDMSDEEEKNKKPE